MDLTASNLQASTLMPDANSTYYMRTKDVPYIADPMSGSTMGLLMILSIMQYEAPYVNPAYSTALSKAGTAAYSQSGGQAFQDRATARVEKEAKGIMTSMGITEGEAAVVVGTAKVVRDKQLDIAGPRWHFIQTHLTAGMDHMTLGIKIEF
jgi:hypothetical protein